MLHMYCLVVILAGIYTVYTYPLTGHAPFPAGFLNSPDTQPMLYQDIQDDPFLPYPPVDDVFVRKRAFSTPQKRASLNQLLRKLIALYGDHDIMFSGKSSHLRFGTGRRR